MKRFRVGYLDRPMHPAFDETARAAPNLSVERIAVNQSHDQIMAVLKQCHGYYVSASQDEIAAPFYAKAPLLEQLPQLLFVCSFGAGYDTIDVDACTRAGIPVVNQAGGNAEGVAEHAVGMMLVLLKRITEAHGALQAGMKGRKEAFMGRELIERTVGLVGLGHVGSRTAQILNAAFRCRVLAYDPYLDAAACKARGAQKVELAELIAQSDVISVHCPLTKETRGMFGADAFAAMRKGTVFVTTARGSIHDETALHEALVSGQVAAAGLDVWAKEPPQPDHPLLSHPAVLASPHTAGVTFESRGRVARMAAEAFIDAAAGRVPPRVLNPQVLPRFKERWTATFGEPVSAK
jgi:D-3-phosphoglycerate dehydrogenase / 2-oxoglutarate reductase